MDQDMKSTVSIQVLTTYAMIPNNGARTRVWCDILAGFVVATN
jgi:hypothetical protein